MILKLIAVGKRMPGWVDEAVSDFGRRFSKGLEFRLIEIGTAKRSRSDHPDVYRNEEGNQMLGHISNGDRVVALDVKGRSKSTEELAAWLDERLLDAKPLTFLIGGPDGLSAACLERADEAWSLSQLTLPHGLARVVVVEALYRADTLRTGHPYHRA